jgi:uncharacterized protein (DUF305 family)
LCSSNPAARADVLLSVERASVRRALLAGAVALAIPLMILAWRGAGYVVGMSDSASVDGGTSAQATGSDGFNEADVEFAQMMIPHHEQAVEMVALAATRATDKRIKQLAVQIQAAQQPELTMLTGFLTAWGKPVASSGGHHMAGTSSMPGVMSAQDMAKLEAATGATFDRMFAEMMIAHHNGAIEMAHRELAKGENADARALAEAIEQDQVTEITLFQEFLAR